MLDKGARHPMAQRHETVRATATVQRRAELATAMAIQCLKWAQWRNDGAEYGGAAMKMSTMAQQ